MITQETLDKVAEIARLHDEAFWHLQQFDSHAKSSDGAVSIEIGFGTVWDRRNGEKKLPYLGVSIYSYVVASSTPSYPNFGQRSHWFETVDEALQVMKEWHEKAMAYSPSEEELAEIDAFALEMWDVIKDKVEVIEVVHNDTENDPS